MNPQDLARQRWKPVRKALEEQEELGLKLSQAADRLAALREELQQAGQTDREAYPAAIAAGKPEPPRKAEQLAVAIEAEQRRVDACAMALESISVKLDRLRTENRSAWRKDALGMIAEAHFAYEECIRLLPERREALADAVALHAWVGDGIGISPIRDALGGRTGPINGREPMSFKLVQDELGEDAMAIATYLREIDPPQSAWSYIRRAEALLGKDTTREQALKQIDPRGDLG